VQNAGREGGKTRLDQGTYDDYPKHLGSSFLMGKIIQSLCRRGGEVRGGKNSGQRGSQNTRNSVPSNSTNFHHAK